jgi:hypothetical protein
MLPRRRSRRAGLSSHSFSTIWMPPPTAAAGSDYVAVRFNHMDDTPGSGSDKRCALHQARSTGSGDTG